MNIMVKNATNIILIIVICLSQTACTNNPKSLDELMQGYADNGRREINSPFSGAVLVAKNGQVIFKESYGFKDRKNNTPNSVDTKFPIASITKQFTAMLIMQMVEEGKLKLSDRVSTVLPFIPSAFGDQITIRQLLSHTSGLPHYEGLIKLGINRDTFVSSAYTPKELALLVSKVELIYPPGSTFHYSSLGYLLLGAILEGVSGQSFATLLKNKITRPLDLKNTGFESNEFMKKETAKGFDFIEDETFWMIFSKYGGDFQQATYRDQSSKYSTGGMYSTVEDLFIWSEAVRKSTLLSKQATKRMFTPNRQGYCYGWFRNSDDLIERNTSVKMYSHGGALDGYRSSINLFDDGTTIIFLSNVAPVKEPELVHQLYLSAHGREDNYRMKGYPDRGSLAEFEEQGGMNALNHYFSKLSDLCGYKVLPSESSIGHLMYLYYKDGNEHRGDSLKQVYFSSYKPTESAINRLGYDFMDNNCETALVFFKENTKRHPQSPNVWDSLGEGFLKCGNYKEAVSSYSKAVAIAKEISDKDLKVYQRNLDNATKSLNSL